MTARPAEATGLRNGRIGSLRNAVSRRRVPRSIPISWLKRPKSRLNINGVSNKS